MDEPTHDQQPTDARPRGSALWRACADGARFAIDEVGWLMRKRIAWPVENLHDALGTRGMIGVFGGGGIAVAGVAAAVAIVAPGGSGASAGTTEAFVAAPRHPPAAAVAPAPEPRLRLRAEPSGPTLHGTPPSFKPARTTRSGVGAGKAIETAKKTSAAAGEATASSAEGPSARGSSAGAGDTPASTARIGATPEASASATSQAGILAKEKEGGAVESTGAPVAGDGLITPPAPKAAKQVARHFAEAFVFYETGGVDTHVRQIFGATSTKQLSKSLLKRPPRQPAGVKVPRAKVVNVVAGPSRGKVYSVSVSLLRVGVTSELRLQMEQGVGKKWQVTNVLG